MEIKQKVAEKIAGSTDAVKEIIIAKLADQEINSRVELAIKGIEKITEIDKELKKIVPDQVSVDANGKELSKTFSKARYEEKKKKEEEKTKVEKALEKALDSGDFSDLKNLINK